jgi:hypothetical protein
MNGSLFFWRSHRSNDLLNASETEFLKRLGPDQVRQYLAVGVEPASESEDRRKSLAIYSKTQALNGL